MVSLELLALKVKLDLLAPLEALAMMDVQAHRALQALLDLRDRLGPPAVTADQAKTASLADQVLQEKTGSPADLDYQVDPDNQVNLARMVSMERLELLDPLVV